MVPRLEKVNSSMSVGALMAFFWAPGCSSWLPGILGTEVDDAQDDSWRGSFVMWLYLTATLSHMGVDVDVLAYHLHWPTVCSCRTRG
jgi:hypothetical protein